MQQVSVAKWSIGTSEHVLSSNEIGELIRTFREKMGLSVDEFADNLGVSRQAVWYWERGRRKPRRAIVAKLYEMGLHQMALEVESARDFVMVIRHAKEKLASDLGIDTDDISIVIQG
jgi:predicted transcriptional regulator